MTSMRELVDAKLREPTKFHPRKSTARALKVPWIPIAMLLRGAQPKLLKLPNQGDQEL